MTTRPPTGPQQVPGWALRANEAMDALLLLLGVTLMWWALTLLGLVVVGIGPATCAAGDILRDRREGGTAPVIRTMRETWRRELVSANVRLLPVAVLQIASLSTMLLAISGRVPQPWMLAPVAVIGAVVLGWSTAGAAALVTVPRLRRQDLLVSWRLALLCPGAVPFAAFCTVIVTAVITVLSIVIPPAGILLGAGGAVQAASAIMGRRTEQLLARHAES